LFVAFAALASALLSGTPLGAAGGPPNTIRFHLFPNAKFVPCLAASPTTTPAVDVLVTRGRLNDRMCVVLRNFKRNLNFDLFTVERSNQLANGQPVQGFTNFGLAWYQSDISTSRRDGCLEDEGEDGSEGQVATVQIKTILLDQIFGFDPDVNLAPTNTFHVGFWFNDPADAAPCGFTGFTPFNGEHHAGPLAFISRPDATTDLGPLCTNPDTSTSPAHCNP
jgi:hypothetical protein